jgi:DNA repair protein RadC
MEVPVMEEESFQSQRYRKSLKQRFLKEGLDGFVEDEVLELLLVYAMPNCDVRPTAKLLLRVFGDFRGVLDAPMKELVAFPGMDVDTSILLKVARDFPGVFQNFMQRSSQEGTMRRRACLCDQER